MSETSPPAPRQAVLGQRPVLPPSVEISPEAPWHAGPIKAILDEAFGPDRFGKTVYRLREGVPPVADLCFVLHAAHVLKGTLRFWPVMIGENTPALLLGPIAVPPADRGKGYARALMWHGLDRARESGHRIVLLVGDAPYYAQFGFERRLAERLALPGWVDEDRFLGLELAPGALRGVAGMVGRADGAPIKADPR
jgi:predicted N-acetyltransferase YhbS